MRTREIWKEIYIHGCMFIVSNTGRLKRPSGTVEYVNKKGTVVTRPRDEIEYIASTSGTGYPKVTISINSKKIYLSIHSLVAEAFLGKRPDGYVVNHKNGVKHDNNIENLEYCTNAENIQHAFDTGLNKAKGVNHHNCILNTHQVNFIKDSIGKMSQRKIAAICGVGEHIVSNIKTGITFTELPERKVTISESEIDCAFISAYENCGKDRDEMLSHFKNTIFKE